MPGNRSSVENRAIIWATRYFEAEGYAVRKVSGVSGHGGYDLQVRRGRTKRKIEVKGCSRPWHIPDLYGTELDARKALIADFLCVVYLVPGKRPRLCLIPRKALPPEMIVPKYGYRIRSGFKNKATLGKFIRTLPRVARRTSNKSLERSRDR